MKHEYSTQQIEEASDLASNGYTRIGINFLLDFLHHLPEPGKTYITNVGIQQQIGRLQDLTSSEHEAAIWLSTLNHLVATGADRKRILKQNTQDGWQECAWGDVLHTDDRVKAEYISGTVIEGVPDGISDNGVYLVDGNLIPYSTDAKWYRIPAPVQHPDPAEHPVILGDTGKPWFWSGTGDEYHSPAFPSTFKSADEFTAWTPATVVPANEVKDND